MNKIYNNPAAGAYFGHDLTKSKAVTRLQAVPGSHYLQGGYRRSTGLFGFLSGLAHGNIMPERRCASAILTGQSDQLGCEAGMQGYYNIPPAFTEVFMGCYDAAAAPKAFALQVFSAIRPGQKNLQAIADDMLGRDSTDPAELLALVEDFDGVLAQRRQQVLYSRNKAVIEGMLTSHQSLSVTEWSAIALDESLAR